MIFFQVRISTIFYKKWGTLNETFLTWNTLACNILSKKSWFLFSDKAQVQKSGDFITSFFCSVKKKEKKIRSNLTHSWNLNSPISSVVFFIYTISVSIFCLSQEEHSLIASNEQIQNFCKSLPFERKRHKSKFLISMNYSV